jgi:uncharacterized delta-60 repeat protein
VNSFCRSICYLFLVISPSALAQIGTLDATFNPPYGYKLVGFDLGNGNTDTPHGIAIADSGEITVGGSVSSVDGSQMVLATLTADGDVTSWWSHMPNSGEEAHGFAVILTSGGPCLAGSASAPFLVPKAHTACPQAGSAVTHTPQQSAPPAWLAATPSSRAVVGGEVFEVAGATGEGEEQNFRVTRLIRTAAGLAPAPGFGVGGSQTVNVLAGHADVATAIVRAADSGVYVAGRVHWSAENNDFVVLKLTATGEIDNIFGEFGPVLIDFALGPASDDRAISVAIDSEQRIIVAGTAARDAIGSDLDVAIVRLLPDGTPDPAFGPEGRRVYSFSALAPELRDEVGGIAIDEQNRIYVIGTLHLAQPENESDIAILRIEESGALDTAFGVGGRAIFDFSPASVGRPDIGVAVAMQAGKPVFLAQRQHDDGSDADFVVFRLLPGERLFADGFESP